MAVAVEIPAGLNTPRVMELTGATERQLTYWCRVGLLRPFQPWPGGPGCHRVWSLNDALKAWAVRELGSASSGSPWRSAECAVAAIEDRSPHDEVCVVWRAGAKCCTVGDVPAFLSLGLLRVLIFPEWAVTGKGLCEVMKK